MTKPRSETRTGGAPGCGTSVARVDTAVSGDGIAVRRVDIAVVSDDIAISGVTEARSSPHLPSRRSGSDVTRSQSPPATALRVRGVKSGCRARNDRESGRVPPARVGTIHGRAGKETSLAGSGCLRRDVPTGKFTLI